MSAFLDNFMFSYQAVIFAVGINGLLALSMYAVLAVGQLSLGQAAFMGIGAYVSALLTINLDWPFPAVLLAAMLVPALLALLIGGPTLRLTGVYLALATIAIVEILRIFLNASSYTGGALGLSGIPNKTTVALIYGSLAVVLAGFVLVARSRLGRAMEAVREDEIAAGVMGVNLPAIKLGALIVSAMIAGLAGALNAHANSFIGPNDYSFEHAVTIISFALLGGIGSPFGPVLGAAILTLLPEFLTSLQDFKLVVNGFIIVVAVLYMPRGLLTWRIGRVGR
ncbi:branched-chain amino acid ABC transporter permease [Tardiphaga sp. vice352]|uniref:branched-chain amino acid ABC transporter permease n=1 Tax=unclassified Tardiphaga TaxID=2631404 RepID=UPI00116547D5|nr:MULTISPECIES: branched-chain amino acid ABC transporter permease [unclassified Tardiphaga]MBC7586697.1 branched-chain amino acid ABC transporter permease [Tardiphaga sp.]QDM15918.1 branched-chain amino acid ABC transporter permease [Tardiphaga sp. vice278]QDM21019.1 branched-chain amino acid ABC transporter permease [Tardiphaga sp. vice154]QDM26115.1 branched-chain amino acid ABC transporter permease [Tardiphaga sp. vice304]QDM31263.1 branched-chain amino acid ABC transporter permease [Tard